MIKFRIKVEVSVMKFRSGLLIFLIFGAATFVFAQNDWDKTPYQSWTKDTVKKVLNDSPWVQTKNFNQPTMQTTQVGTIMMPGTPARILLRSALTVRQALLRERQLDEKYDKKSDADKKVFDAKNSALLDCPACKDYYVVTVAYGYLSMENKYYLDDKKKYVYLSNEAGDKRELAEFAVVAQRNPEIAFYFPRRNEKGEDLLNSKNTKLIFNFEPNGLDEKSVFPFKKVEFDLSKMVKDGVVIF